MDVSVRSVAVLGLLLTVCTSYVAGQPTTMVGYQEGSRRTVACLSGGHVTGLDLHYGSQGIYAEKFVVGARLLCSTGSFDVEYWGTRGDEHTWGTKTREVRSVRCEGGVHGIKWRPTPFNKGQQGEFRFSGVTLECSDGSLSKEDVKPDALHKNHLGCATKGHRLTSVVLWWNYQYMFGLEGGDCAPAA